MYCFNFLIFGFISFICKQVESACLTESTPFITTTTTSSITGDRYCFIYSQVCGENGRCIDTLNGGGSLYSCDCDSGYYFNEETCVEATTMPTTTSTPEIIGDPYCFIMQNPCGNGRCVDINGGSYYRCDCDSGYYFNEQTCVEATTTPTTTSTPEIIGDRFCDLNSNICGDNGRCVDTTDGSLYSCDCDSGYYFNEETCVEATTMPTTTSTPEIIGDPYCFVMQNPCGNGRCVDTTDGSLYRCDCDSGYYFNEDTCVEATTMPTTTSTPEIIGDRFCDLNSNICGENGRCVNAMYDPYYTCDCNEGYGFNGENCVQSTTTLLSTTTTETYADTYCIIFAGICGANGRCVDTTDGSLYTCECYDGYSFILGEGCAQFSSTTTTTPID